MVNKDLGKENVVQIVKNINYEILLSFIAIVISVISISFSIHNSKLQQTITENQLKAELNDLLRNAWSLMGGKVGWIYIGEYAGGESLNEAKYLIDQCIIQLPSYAPCHMNLGVYYIGKRELNKAQESLQYALELNAKSTQTLLLLANVYSSKKDFETSIDLLNKAVSIDNEFINGFMALSSDYSDLGDFDKALSFAKKAHDIKPVETEVLRKIAWIYGEMKNEDKAVEYLKKSLILNKNNKYILADLGDSYYNLKKDNEAFSYFRKALEIDPGFVSAHQGLGAVYAARKDVGNTISQFTEAINLTTGDAEKSRIYLDLSTHLSYISELYFEEGKKDKVREVSELASSYTKTGTQLYINYAERQTIVYPNEPDLLLDYGIALHNADRKKEAFESFERAYELDPLNIRLLDIYLGQLLERGANEQVIEAAKKAIKNGKETKYILSNIAIALSNLERYQEAIPYYKKAIALQSEGDTTLYMYLSDALLFSGQRLEAEKYRKIFMSK